MKNTAVEVFPEIVKNDPRIGLEATITATGLRARIEIVHCFADGFEQFTVLNEDGIGEYLNADEVEFLGSDPRVGLVVSKGGYTGPVMQVSSINGMEYIHYGSVDDLHGAFGWDKFKALEEK